MYDTKIRVAIVKKRINIIHRKQESHRIAILSVLCLMLAGSLAGVSRVWYGDRQGLVTGLYGTTMLLDDVGGYVLVGVIAFSVAVAVTVLCIRCRGKEKIKKAG